MHRSIVFLLCVAVSGASVAGDPVEEFRSAQAQWRGAAIQSYTFTYEDRSEVIVAPKCGGAQIRVSVMNGVGGVPVVVHGVRHCPAGTRGRAIDLSVPLTIEDTFKAMDRYINNPPTAVRVAVTYDSRYGYPISYHVEKLEFSDNDEGFVIANFSVQR